MPTDREALLSSTAELLTRKPTASMDEVAKAAGISRATLHRQYPSREVLVQALEELGLARLDAALDAARVEEGEAPDAVRRVVAETEPLAGFLAFLVTENQLFEPGQQHPGWRRIDERIAALFARGQESGFFRPELTAAFLTEALYALITAAAWAVQDGKVAARSAGPMTVELLLEGATRRRG